MRLTLLAAAPILAMLSGCGPLMMKLALKPRPDFAEQTLHPRLDYADPQAWWARPGMDDPSDRLPEGIAAVPEEDRPADVFFVAPTTWFDKGAWNASLDDPKTETLTRYILAAEATPFTAAARVWAPRYRQASVYVFFAPDDDGRAALDLAYGDVLAAFDHYLEHDNDGRPFLVVGHSQGTTHALRLLADRVAGTALADRFVAAYLIGDRLPMDVFDRRLPGIQPCATSAQTGCVVAYDAVSEPPKRLGVTEHRYPAGWEPDTGKAHLCVDPITWSLGGAGDPQAHAGGVPIDMPAWMGAMRDKDPVLEVPDVLPAVQPARVGARCVGDFLVVTEPGDERYVLVRGSYHGAEYPLFWADLRLNSVERVAAWVERRERRTASSP